MRVVQEFSYRTHSNHHGSFKCQSNLSKSRFQNLNSVPRISPPITHSTTTSLSRQRPPAHTTPITRASSQQAATTSTATSERSLPKGFEVYSSDGKWKVRLVDPTNREEIQAIIQLQTDGFHTPNPVPILDDTFKNFFKAEVVSEMNKKLKYNPADRFACLVVMERNGSVPIGVVEVSYIDVKEILKSLEEGTEGFVYIASMAVDTRYRRRGVASALLKGAESVARKWEERQALLHVYQDNTPAIELYKNRGYDIIYQDAPWLAKLAVRPRYLMRKKW